jgi:hypothetical protein
MALSTRLDRIVNVSLSTRLDRIVNVSLSTRLDRIVNVSLLTRLDRVVNVSLSTGVDRIVNVSLLTRLDRVVNVSLSTGVDRIVNVSLPTGDFSKDPLPSWKGAFHLSRPISGNFTNTFNFNALTIIGGWIKVQLFSKALIRFGKIHEVRDPAGLNPAGHRAREEKVPDKGARIVGKRGDLKIVEAFRKGR